MFLRECSQTKDQAWPKGYKVCHFVTGNRFTAVSQNDIMGNRNRVLYLREGDEIMARMFRVLGFWTLVIALMAFAGDMNEMALLFFIQTVVFVLLGYLNFSEKTYMLMFWGYMFISFVGFTYWTVFVMGNPF